MVYVILRLIFFYILFLVVRSFLRSFIVKKIRKNFDFGPHSPFEHKEQDFGNKQSSQKSDVIEAEFRKR